MAKLEPMTLNGTILVNENASLRLKLEHMTGRYEMSNRSNNVRANERADICQQLYHYGLMLTADSRIVKLPIEEWMSHE